MARRHRRDPVQPGISISHALVSAGTIGAIVFDRTTGAPCILSNWHVLAGSVFAQAGDAILQPGRFDSGRRETDTIAHLERMYLGRRGDAAIAVLNGERQVSRIQDHTTVDVQTARHAGLGDSPVRSSINGGATRRPNPTGLSSQTSNRPFVGFFRASVSNDVMRRGVKCSRGMAHPISNYHLWVT